MAPDKEKIIRAFQAMKNLGIAAEAVKPVLKRLLKLYNKNWNLIEEDNYRTLADAIFEGAEDKADENGDMVDEDEDEDIAPPCKKLNKGLTDDQDLSTLDDNKNIIGIERNEHRRNSNGKRMVESSQSLRGACASEPGHISRPAPTVKKEKHPISVPAQEKTSTSRGLVIGPKQPMTDSSKKKKVHKIHDITKGTEKVNISLIDEIGNEDLSSYMYCPENIVYQSAYVHVSLARVADEDCCGGCTGDCLSSSYPCACARDTGGEYAYTPEGLLNQRFLQSCISMKLEQKAHHLCYCDDCPLERPKKANARGKCKGHLVRKFIKECWRKCGCTMQCANRVVQRGITRKLQVFVTSEGKGWGVRTLEDLPEGAFICEYAGEILTNTELYKRNMSNNGKDKHVYPVLLDADWASEKFLKDEDALCLDATNYGNVARFINHRCFDGNLIDIPVQVETPDRHYYHLAFFTKRKVKALEELTWDYGIDFDDHDHPIEAFQCSCGSQYCRDSKDRRGRK